MHQTRLVPSLEKRQALQQLLLDSRSPFEDVDINASLWKQLAVCVFLQSFCGESYRESICQSLWLQSCPAEHSPCRTADSTPPLHPLFSATASPLLPLHVPASDGLLGRRTVWSPFYQTHLSVNRTHTGHRKYSLSLSLLSHDLDLGAGMKQIQESVRWMKAWRSLRINKYSVLVTLTIPVIPAAN